MGHTEPLARTSTATKPVERPLQHPRAKEYHLRHHRHHRGLRTRFLILLSLVTSIAAIGAFVGWIGAWVDFKAEEKERFELAAALRQQEQEYDIVKSRADTLAMEMADLVKTRIPGLRGLVFDHTVPIGDRYVKNVSFTRTGTGEDRDYEYRLVLENRTPQVVRPALEILLFNRVGLQTGSIRLTHDAGVTERTLDLLATGETRAYTGIVPIMQDREPVYFMIAID